MIVAGGVIALLLLGGSAAFADSILDGLGVEPETFRVGAGVVMMMSGALAVWNGGAAHRGPWEGDRAALFPLALPVIATPAAVAAAISYGADRGQAEVLAAIVPVVLVCAGILAMRAGRFEAAADGVARITGGLLVIVAAGLIVSGVRAI